MKEVNDSESSPMDMSDQEIFESSLLDAFEASGAVLVLKTSTGIRAIKMRVEFLESIGLMEIAKTTMVNSMLKHTTSKASPLDVKPMGIINPATGQPVR